MARVARIVIPGLPHHVTQRGNRTSAIFHCADDYRTYRTRLLEFIRAYSLELLAYCFMPNHVHLVIVPSIETALAQGMRDLQTAYARQYNDLYGTVGHLWQGRFFSCVMDEMHMWAAIRYIERNPVRAGLVLRAEEYPWSSARAHCGLRKDPLLSAAFPYDGVIDNCAAWLADSDATIEEQIRQCSHTGRPCGSAHFVETLEQQLGRPLAPQKRGPKKRN